MSKKEKKNFIRILIALSMFSIILIIDKTINLGTLVSGQFGWLLPFVLYLVVYIIIGYDVLLRAFRNILHGQIFDENFLMCIATLGAFSLAIYLGSTGKAIEGFDEACAVLLFYQVGEFFQNYATRKSRKSIPFCPFVSGHGRPMAYLSCLGSPSSSTYSRCGSSS